jgi:hypothetical protein
MTNFLYIYPELCFFLLSSLFNEKNILETHPSNLNTM